MSDILEPLYELTLKNHTWKWTKNCQNSFDKIKRIMASSDVLVHYNPELELKLACDASQIGLGAVLYHVFEDGTERPISYASKVLSKAQRNYSTIHKEALALVFGVQKFYQYLFGRSFTLVTDHKPLVAIFGDKKGIPTMAASRLQRYALLLSGYNNIKLSIFLQIKMFLMHFSDYLLKM